MATPRTFGPKDKLTKDTTVAMFGQGDGDRPMRRRLTDVICAYHQRASRNISYPSSSVLPNHHPRNSPP